MDKETIFEIAVKKASESVLVQDAKKYGILCHESTNHRYDGHEYSFHLQMVEDVAKEYIHLTTEGYYSYLLASCWTHDVIEDCRQTYNDVQGQCGTIITETEWVEELLCKLMSEVEADELVSA